MDAARSLEQVALDLLTRREHTRLELFVKLKTANARLTDPEDEAAIQELLDRLESSGLLSTARAAQMIVDSRAKKRGSARILAELREKGVDSTTIEIHAEALKGDEFARAQAVWQKKFKALPQNPTDYARQGRFLASRGFSLSVIHRVLGGRTDILD